MIRCTVYNASYEPLYMVEATEGLVMTLRGKAFIFEEVEGQHIRTVREKYPMPASVVLYRYVPPVRGAKRQSKFNKHNLYVRDKHTCGYCGRHETQFEDHEYLTRDHIIPESKGGRTEWMNLMTACSTCNGRKDNRTPAQAGMRLLREPYVPTIYEVKARKQKRRFRH